MSLKATIAAAEDLPTSLETVEEWGGVKLLLRALNGEDFAWLARSLSTVGESGSSQLEFALESASDLIQRGTWDPDSPKAHVFDPDDIKGILDLKSFDVRQRLALKIVSLTMPSSVEVSAEKKECSPEATSDSGTS
jgi:hypothetical protein